MDRKARRLRSVWRVLHGVAACSIASLAIAQPQTSYPVRPVQVIVGFPASGSVDLMARRGAAEMSNLLGQNFVVVNRDGASGTIGFSMLATARPDGYILGGGPTTPISNAPHFMKGLKYTVDSFEYVCHTFENVFAIVVRPESPFKTLQDLIATARANPGKLSFASSGVGTVPHLAISDFAHRQKLALIHTPYRGEAPMIPDLISGRVDFSGTSIASVIGRGLRPLGFFGDERHPAFPDIPTLQELGIPSLPGGLNGFFAPKGTPEPILKLLESNCEKMTKSESFQEAAKKLNQRVKFLSRRDFAKKTAEDFRLKAELVKALGLATP